MSETHRSVVKKCAKTTFAGFKVYFDTHACSFGNAYANACVSEARMIFVLLRWAPSLNDRSKLKGKCTDVKSGCGPSVGPSLSPHSLS